MSVILLTADSTVFTADSIELTADMTQLVTAAPPQSANPLALLERLQLLQKLQPWRITGVGGIVARAAFGRPVVGATLNMLGAAAAVEWGGVAVRRGVILADEDFLLFAA